MAAIEGDTYDIAEEDLLRARLYSLLGRFLAQPPQPDDLALAAGLHGDNTELGRGIATLSKIARHTTPEAAEEEFSALFVGMGSGILVPCASYYLREWRQDALLQALRADMARLDLPTPDDFVDGEDHIAALCETMAGAITGLHGEPLPLDQQMHLFERYIASWAEPFFADLERARASRLYAAIGAIGRAFVGIERHAFKMIAN